MRAWIWADNGLQHDHVLRRGTQPGHEPGHIVHAGISPAHASSGQAQRLPDRPGDATTLNVRFSAMSADPAALGSGLIRLRSADGRRQHQCRLCCA